MDEVHGLAVDLGDEVRYGVHPGLLRTPVELLPGGDHVLQVRDRRPAIPAVIGCFDRVAGVGEAALQVVERSVGMAMVNGRIVPVGRRLMFWSCLERRLCLGQLRSASSTKIHRCTRLPVDYWLCSGSAVPHMWSGAELATQLEVSGRTVRNDIERLRQLDYPVEAVRGPGGHYRLGVGAKLPRCSSTTTRRWLSRWVCARSPELAA